MNDAIRQVITAKFGALMVSNAELTAQTVILRQQCAAHEQHIAMLKDELARWQQDAQKPAEPPAVLDRPEGVTENIPANPYGGGDSGTYGGGSGNPPNTAARGDVNGKVH